MCKPKRSHYQVAVKILKYVKETLRHGILFPSVVSDDAEMICYSDSNWCGVRVDRRNTIRYMFMYQRAQISQCFKKKPVVALSACEAEYTVDALLACQTVWPMNLLQELKFKVNKLDKLIIYNKYAIRLAKDPMLYGRSKHIDNKYHFMRNQVQNGVLEDVHVNTQKQFADVLTNTIKDEHFIKLRDEISLLILT